MMPASPISRLSLIGAAVLLSLTLGGCANDEARRITFATWKQAEPVPQPQLVQVPVHHTVVFPAAAGAVTETERSEEHTSELQSLMRISYAVFCLKKKTH